MKTITFYSLKGGTGKSSTANMVANCLASTGKKVLMIDLDINGSTSILKVPLNFKEYDPLGNKHIAAALQSETDFFKYAIPSTYENIDIMRSSLHLIDLRLISTFKLKNILERDEKSNPYDYLIIDTPATYDNFTLMATEASDSVVIPVLPSKMDFNTTVKTLKKLKEETQSFEKCRIFFNQWKYSFEERQIKSQSDYQQLFEKHFQQKVLKTRIPFTSLMRQCTDRELKLGSAKNHQQFKNAIINLTEEIIGKNLEVGVF